MKERIIRALSEAPLDYGRHRAFLKKRHAEGEPWQETSVLLLLSPWSDLERRTRQWSFLLNKRSQVVPQPGDLCFPGGHPHPRADRFIANVLIPHVFPMKKSPGYLAARGRGRADFSAIRFFLAGPRRSSSKHSRTAHLEFLGPCPGYRMLTRRRIIYPMAAALTRPRRPRAGAEVEKTVPAPVESFFSAGNYGTVTWELTGRYRSFYKVDTADFPCFLVRGNGAGEILWGATLNICLAFLRMVFGFEPPADGPVRVSAPLYPARA